MNRVETIKKLIKEGFSEKTLVAFNDNQLKKLANKILSEEPVLNIPKDNKQAITAAQQKKQQFVAYEEKSAEINETAPWNYYFAAVERLQKKLGKEPTKAQIDAEMKRLAKPISKKEDDKSDKKDIKEFVDNVVDKQYHSMATKSEMIEMIKSKVNGVVSEDLTEKRIPKLPEFLSYDAIVHSGSPEPETAPNEPDIEVDPDVATPPSREDDPRRSPFRNPNEDPAENPGTKAKVRRLHKEKLPMAAE